MGLVDAWSQFRRFEIRCKRRKRGHVQWDALPNGDIFAIAFYRCDSASSCRDLCRCQPTGLCNQSTISSEPVGQDRLEENKMDRNAKAQEIVDSLGQILVELDEMREDMVAIKIAEAISGLSKSDPASLCDQKIQRTG